MYGLTATDSYKLGHKLAYDDEITRVYSNMTSRNGRLSNIKDNKEVVFVGLQAYIMDYLINEINETFFNVDKNEAIEFLTEVFESNIGPYDASHFEELWELGYLPIRIKALPEGTLVPYGVPPVTFENTVDGFEWLSNYLETVMSSENWMIQTSATTSLAYYKAFKEAFEKTGGPMELLPFMGHDFSFRGMAGRHAAAASGFGHLASGFAGTDTLPSLLFAKKYYGADLKSELVGVSVFATEHSTMTSSILKKIKEFNLSKGDAEKETFLELMNKVPEGILSVVSDSFDFWHVVTDILPSIKDEIMARNGKLVIRPDSGDPVDIIAGYAEAVEITCEEAENQSFWVNEFDYNLVTWIDRDGVRRYSEYDLDYWPNGEPSQYYLTNEVTEAEAKGLFQCLWEIFGGTQTEKGYNLLEEHIGAIYGDSITPERQEQIIERLIAKGFCPTVVLGIGSFSFQYVTRDTHGSAVKATNITANGEDIAICKDPKTDSKKKSAQGLLRVEREDGQLVVYDNQTREEAEGGLLKEVFKDGKITRVTTLSAIRELVQSQI